MVKGSTAFTAAAALLLFVGAPTASAQNSDTRPCVTDAECEPRVCRARMCRLAYEGEGCDPWYMCDEGLACCENICVPSSSTDPRSCPPGGAETVPELPDDGAPGGDVAVDVGCTDVAPDDQYTCAEQAGWGQCDQPWMQGFCELTCGTCAE